MYQNKRVYFSCIWSSEAVRLPVTIAMLIDFALGSKLRQAIQLPAPIPLQLAGLARFADKYEQGRAWRSDSIPAALGLKPVALTAMVIRDSASVKVHPCEVRGGDFGDGNFEEDKRRRPNRGSVPYNSATRQLKPMSHCSSFNSDLSGG